MIRTFFASAALVVAAATASADLVTWNSAGASIYELGNNHVNSDPGVDTVILSASSGSFSLSEGSPVIVAINPLLFVIGQTGDQPDESYSLTTNFAITRDLTVNGITHSFSTPMTHTVGWFADSLQAHDGAYVDFGDIRVTPLGWADAFADGGGSYDQTSPSWHTIQPLFAEFRIVPAPTTLAAFSLLGLGAARRRR